MAMRFVHAPHEQMTRRCFPNAFGEHSYFARDVVQKQRKDFGAAYHLIVRADRCEKLDWFRNHSDVQTAYHENYDPE